MRHRGFSRRIQDIYKDVDGSILLSPQRADLKSIECMGLSVNESNRMHREVKQLKADIAKNLKRGKWRIVNVLNYFFNLMLIVFVRRKRSFVCIDCWD